MEKKHTETQVLSALVFGFLVIIVGVTVQFGFGAGLIASGVFVVMVSYGHYRKIEEVKKRAEFIDNLRAKGEDFWRSELGKEGE